MAEERSYIAIDLKSFYASVECNERGLDPLTTNLVVADQSRTEKTICLAVSPSLKAYGIPGRARLFEVVQRVKEVNAQRRGRAPGRSLSGQSYDAKELAASPELELSYIVATPRMGYYMSYSTKIYDIYLKYVSADDIHVYSIDEVFIDATDYLPTYKLTARELAMRMIHDVLETTHITATVGIGSNMYLSKIAMDVMAKHITPDENGARIAELDEMSYRRELWDHRPLTDFWRVGRGYSKKLEQAGLYTMGDIARCSLGRDGDYYNEELLYRLFGVNAELLIDHAWGWENCTIADVKAYRPTTNSISSGQVLQSPYDFEKARLIVHEMTDQLSLELVDKGLVTDQMVLTIIFDVDSLKNPEVKAAFKEQITEDYYGRATPKNAHGTANLGRLTASARLMTKAMLELYDSIVDKRLLVRKVYVVANNVISERDAGADAQCEQLDLFTDYDGRRQEELALEREKKRQQAIVKIKRRYGKNAVLKGMNFEEGATTISRNSQIGGHRE